jgi:cytochrome c nitrite reductase small subunit
MKRLIKFIIPPPKWRKPVIILVGIMFGLAAFTFHISKATSYLSDDSETCINCHIMVPQYTTWGHSSHREWTNCNDCHVPHDNVANKYYFKAKDGLRHATIFTLRNEPQVIFIKEEGKRVVHQNCIRCHEKLLTDDKLLAMTNKKVHPKTDRVCWDCHREVPHGRVNSLASTPNARTPVENRKYPDWLKNALKNQKKETK